MICRHCHPWNLPLMQPAYRDPMGVVAPMPFHGWLWYHQHIVLHQADNWAGEIDAVSAALQTGTITLAEPMLAPALEMS